jgi:predicted enzyme related to lactoylglutathione lyase
MKEKTNMSAATKKKSKSSKTKAPKAAHGIVWFEIPADDAERARKFYSGLFGWKITRFPGMADYWHIDTGGADASPDGGLMVRKQPQQGITNYMNVDSVDKFAAKIEKLGGKICMAKTEVPEMGYFAICQDTENNVFAIWERIRSK